jgi:hypothetical protein
VEKLSSEECEGRLTGAPGYDRSASWVIDKFTSWDVKPLGEKGKFQQYFPHPYTEVFPGCELILHTGTPHEEERKYEYVEEFIPGSTSGNGKITVEVVYAEGFIYSHIGETAMEDIFLGTWKTPRRTVKKIRKKLKPRSFETGKIFTIRNNTEHHPDGIGSNVIGFLEGSDPVLSLYSAGNPEAFANYRYHTPYDNISNINAEVMCDLAQLLFLSMVNMAHAETLEFERGEPRREFIE